MLLTLVSPGWRGSLFLYLIIYNKNIHLNDNPVHRLPDIEIQETLHVFIKKNHFNFTFYKNVPLRLT